MTIYSLRAVAVAVATLFASGVLTQDAQAQFGFTNDGEVSDGSPISGFLTDAAGDSIGYEISALGPLVFGWNGSTSSEPGGVQHNFNTVDDQGDVVPVNGPIEWLFRLEFDSPIASLSLSQTPVRTAGNNSGGLLGIDSDAASATVFAGTQGLGTDGLSNLNSVAIDGGNVGATLARTDNNEDDWLVTLNNVQTVTIQYDPTTNATPDITSGIGAEWLTFSNATISAATIAAIPEPSTFFGLTALFTATAMRRRRS